MGPSKLEDLLFSQLPISGLLLCINGFVIRPADSLQEAQTGISSHGGIHLITW